MLTGQQQVGLHHPTGRRGRAGGEVAARILTKLGVRDRVQAVVVAYRTGFAAREV